MIDEEDEEAFTSSAVTNMEFMFLKTWLHDRPCQGLLHSQIMLVRKLCLASGCSECTHTPHSELEAVSTLFDKLHPWP